jgi:type II secretory pathway predicted ATPase ExeA
MSDNSKFKSLNPFRRKAESVFVCGEAQEEALARIDYLHQHGVGWCLVSGPRGIGKTTLLGELARRARRRGAVCRHIDCEASPDGSWWPLLSQAFGREVVSPVEGRREIEEQLFGLAALNRPLWLLVDQSGAFTLDVLRGCRWFVSTAERAKLTVTVVVAGENEADLRLEADLHLELWPWDASDCERYVKQSLTGEETAARFSDEALAVLHERTGGIPRALAHLCEWTWLAAQAEAIDDIDGELVHALADELMPSGRKPASYEMSAAYGGW